MIYKVKIIIEIAKKEIGNNYYNNLGSIYNILGNNKVLNNSIISVSNINRYSDILSNVNISIKGKENFDKIISIILNKKEINLNGKIFKIKGIDFNFSIFNENIEYIDFKQIEITFKTPTFTKKELNGVDINQLLPIPEIFLLSAIRRYNNIYSKELNLNNIKDSIKNNVIVVKFDISTKTTIIKKNIKAGVVGKIKYEISKEINLEIKKIIYTALKLANIIGIGTGIKLGLGKVGVYFINK